VEKILLWQTQLRKSSEERITRDFLISRQKRHQAVENRTCMRVEPIKEQTKTNTRFGLRTAELKANNFFIEIQQDYTKFMEVTVIPPSFLIKN
jgi:ATP-dependent protease HslVU (ClpYQ) ATPase subunit